VSQKSTQPYDVVLSHARVDEPIASAVCRHLEGTGLRVFMAGGLGEDARSASEVRRAIQESVSLVVLLTPTHARSDSVGIEVGAAWMWSTPIYLLLSDLPASAVPGYLRRYPSWPVWEGLDDVAEEVRKHAKPLTDRDRDTLAEVYREVGVSVDHLIADPSAGDRLAGLFAERADRPVQQPRLLRELLRIRKSGKLPKVVNGTGS
jgi:hypothetical protein